VSVDFCRHQLELPGRYDKLKAFWEDKKGTLPQSGTGRSMHSSPSSDILPADLKVWLVCEQHVLKFKFLVFFMWNKI